MQRGNVVLAGILTLAMGLTACSTSSSELTSNTHLTIAIKRDQPGLAKSGSGSHYEGFEVQLARAFDEKFGTGKGFVPYGVTSSDRDTVLGTAGSPGSADVVIATYSITNGRLGDYDMIGPYLKTGLGVLVGKHDKSVGSVSDLEDKEHHVCTARGTATSDTTSEKVLKGLDVKTDYLENFSECVDGLRDGVYTAVVTDEIILRGFANDPEYRDDVRLADITSVGDTNFYAIAIRRGNDELCDEIQSWLKDYVESNKWDLSFQNFFGGQLDRSSYKPGSDEITSNSCGDPKSPR